MCTDGGVGAWLGEAAGCLQGGCGRRARRAASTRLGLLLLVAGGHLEQVVDDTVDVRVRVRVGVRV